MALVYNDGSKKCLLCFEEKSYIVEYPEKDELLNKKFHHETKLFLNYLPTDQQYCYRN